MRISLSLGPCLKYYSVISQEKDLYRFFRPIVCQYIKKVMVPHRCQLCQCQNLCLTAHHLVLRSAHLLAFKRKWHIDSQINKVAHLCWECHELALKVASTEALAKNYWSIELLLERKHVWLYVNTVGEVGEITGNVVEAEAALSC